MGLSAYGKPALCPPGLAGTVYDWQAFLTEARGASVALEDLHEALLDLMVKEATRRGYDLSFLENEASLPSPIAADLAASSQKIFSDSLFAVVNAAKEGLRDVSLSSRNLCLGGGAALNCPSNTRPEKSRPAPVRWSTREPYRGFPSLVWKTGRSCSSTTSSSIDGFGSLSGWVWTKRATSAPMRLARFSAGIQAAEPKRRRVEERSR